MATNNISTIQTLVIITLILSALVFLGSIAFFIYSLLKKKEQDENLRSTLRDMVTPVSQTQLNILSEIGKFRLETVENLLSSQANHSDKLNSQIQKIYQTILGHIDDSSEKTNTTITKILQRLAKIDEAQKQIEKLSGSVIGLQDILTDKKTRGIFGEVQLEQILSSVFGDKADALYEIQYLLSNGTIVDAVLKLPPPTGIIPIDSKFPLENYQRMNDQELSDSQRATAKKSFRQNIKKHIDDISSKYLIPNETADHALLFFPAEAIFAEVQAYHYDLVEYAYKKKVWPTSPTTLLAILSTVQVIVRNKEQSRYAAQIQIELQRLSEDFVRYSRRWEKLSKHMDTVQKDVKDIHTSTQKINSKFEKIKNVSPELIKNANSEELSAPTL